MKEWDIRKGLLILEEPQCASELCDTALEATWQQADTLTFVPSK